MVRMVVGAASAGARPYVMPHVERFFGMLVLMGFFSSLFGCSKGDDAPRFVTEAAFQETLAKQEKMSPMTLAQLRKLGVAESKSLKLEFFFYTDTQAKAQSLATALKGLQYDAKAQPTADNARQFVITGWSTPVRMSESEVVYWTNKMCRTGFEHDAEFDGWGTSPE